MLLDFRSMPILHRVFTPAFLFVLMLIFLQGEISGGPIYVGFSSIMFMCVLVLLILQPFAVAKKNTLETLYATMSLRRDDVVKARYLYSVCILAAVMLPPLLFRLLVFPDNEAPYSFVTLAFLTVSFVIAILYPLSFKIGYIKASTIFFISFFIYIFIFISIFVTRSSFMPEFPGLFAKLIPATSHGQVGMGLLLLCLSYLLSRRIYRTRDL